MLLGSLSASEMIIALVLLLLVIGAYFAAPKIEVLLENRKKNKLKMKNKSTIQDLKMMKEIQSEIDEEMRQALMVKGLREKEEKDNSV